MVTCPLAATLTKRNEIRAFTAKNRLNTSYAVHANDQTSVLEVSNGATALLSSNTSSGAIHRTDPWTVVVVFPDGPIRSSITFDRPKSVRTA